MRLRLAILVSLAACIEPAMPPPRPDAGPGAPCDPFAPVACTSSESCQPASDGTWRCNFAGTGGDQDLCSADQPCGPGFVCAAPARDAHALCLRPCRGDGACPQSRGIEFCDLALDASVTLCHPMVGCDRLASPSPCQTSEKCSLERLPGPFVCLRAGTLGDYQPCAAESDCASGYTCVSYDGAPAQCAALCYTDSFCPQMLGPELCLRRDVPTEPPVMCERVTPCIPASPVCPSAQACYPYKPSVPSIHLEAICRLAGTLADGARCEALNDCADGLVCFQPYPQASATCLPVCSTEVGGTPACPSGHSCMPITAHYGACW